MCIRDSRSTPPAAVPFIDRYNERLGQDTEMDLPHIIDAHIVDPCYDCKVPGGKALLFQISDKWILWIVSADHVSYLHVRLSNPCHIHCPDGIGLVPFRAPRPGRFVNLQGIPLRYLYLLLIFHNYYIIILFHVQQELPSSQWPRAI